nr:hypothetical protein [Tanacetum cinerariifolium]
MMERVIFETKSSTITPLITLRVVFGRRCICLFDLVACHLVEVLRMISKVELQASADLKSILYGLRSERFGIEFYVKPNLDTRLDPKSDKESLEVKKSANILIIHDDEEEEVSDGDALIRRKRETRKGIKEIRDTLPRITIRSPMNHIAPISLDKETL